MAKRSNQQNISEVIKDMLRVYGLESKFEEVEVRQAWADIMGVAIANKTRYLRVRNRTLLIQMDSGVLKEEFSYAKERIVTLINEKVGRPVIDQVEVR